MTLSLSTSQNVLHTKSLALSRRHRLVETRLIEILAEIDHICLFKVLGYSSLFVYTVRSLGFSESTAYALIAVARKAKEVSQLKAALIEEKLTVARASRITSVLTAENATALITFAAQHSARETDREVARIAGHGRDEKRRAVLVSDEVLDLLKRAQSLLASRKRKHIAPHDTLKLVLEDYLERHDPVKKAERAESRKFKKGTLNSEQSESTNAVPHIQPHKRQSIGSAIDSTAVNVSAPTKSVQTRRTPLAAREKHAVFRRDGGRCAFVDPSGKRCQSERWLHLHHLRPVSLGGGNDIENLTTLCSFHHDLVHQQCLPLDLKNDGRVNWLKAPTLAYCH